MVQQPTVHILWSENSLTIVNSFPALERELHYVHRSFTENKEIEREKIRLFNLISNEGEPVRIIQTFQGLRDHVLRICLKHGRPPLVHDKRTAFPDPRYDLMHGFRFSQKELLTSFLAFKRSGTLRAPTRYGKTTLIINTLRAFPGLKTVITAPGVDLCRQTMDDVIEKCPNREVAGLFTGSRFKHPSEDITVVSMDSLDKCDLQGTKLLLIDEPHSAVTASRGHLVNAFTSARRLGFGASLEGRFDGSDILIEGIIGPPLAQKSYVEARDEGAVAPIKVFIVNIPFPAIQVRKRDHAYDKMMMRNPNFHRLVVEICQKAIPKEWQTLIFIDDEKQAEALYDLMPDGTIAMAKRMSPSERAALTERVKANEIKRCICSDIYSTGVTFHEVKALVNTGGGGGNIGCTQKPGRLAEIRPDKKCGVVVDFMFRVDDPMGDGERNPSMNAWTHVVRDCWSRHRVYKERGYEIEFVDSVAELRSKIELTCI